MTKDQVVGTWQLVSFKATAGGQVSYPLGKRPGGYIGLTGERFWSLVLDSNRSAPAGAEMTEAEALALMKSNSAYTGKYDADPVQTPDGIKIVIHVDAAVAQAIAGTDRIFFVRVDGNKLTLKSPLVFVPPIGQTTTVELDFVRAS